MNENRAAQLARLTPDQLNRYQRLKTIAITLGFLSLFSFWIMVALNEALPWDGPTYSMGSLARLYVWAPFGFVIALFALAMSLNFMNSARRIRQGSDKPSEQ